jgi:hypothetical protein
MHKAAGGWANDPAIEIAAKGQRAGEQRLRGLGSARWSGKNRRPS